MLSIGLWRFYINTTITNLVIIHRRIFYINHDVSETELSPFSGGTRSVGPNRASFCLGVLLQRYTIKLERQETMFCTRNNSKDINLSFFQFVRKNSVAWVRERTIPTEFVGEDSANFYKVRGVSRNQRGGSRNAGISVFYTADATSSFNALIEALN
jgi:hypothetical protein